MCKNTVAGLKKFILRFINALIISLKQKCLMLRSKAAFYLTIIFVEQKCFLIKKAAAQNSAAFSTNSVTYKLSEP